MNKLSTERAIDALDTVRAYYASLTAGYPKGKDCKAIDDVTCSEIANSCLMAIKALEQERSRSAEITQYRHDCEKLMEENERLKKALEQEPCEDCISRQAVLDAMYELCNTEETLEENPWRDNPHMDAIIDEIENLPSVTPTHKEWIPVPEGATNKDIFETIFGYEPATDAVVCNKEDWCGASKPCNYCISNPNNIGREEEWWNAPYSRK